MSVTYSPADSIPLLCLWAPLLFMCLWRTVWHVLTSHSNRFILTLNLCLDLLGCLCCCEFEKQNIISVYLSKLSFVFGVLGICFVFIARFPSISSLFCLPFFAQSQILLFISLFLFLPSSFFQTFVASLFSLPFTPSQDKQPLYWGMSAICSKKLLDAVQTWVPEGREAYKFSAFSQSLPLFFISLGLLYSFFSSKSHDFISHLKSSDSLCELQCPATFMLNFVFLLFLPIWPYRVLKFPSCSLNADLFSGSNFHHSSQINTQRENQTPVLMPLSSLCQVPWRVTLKHTTHFSDSVAKHSQFGICLSLSCLGKLFQCNDLKWTFLWRQGCM